ncbi:uncharacterized protein SAMN06296386_113104 [Lachnospiraceae bacterium]|nr:uncharacterized protein SAMN06296386_113104 [Lachnospiraceae bacterium]
MKERIRKYGSDILNHETYATLSTYMQHGSVSVMEHCLRVAETSLRISDWMKRHKIECHERELVRGALLHDYFLYDWHNTTLKYSLKHGFHGFTHARIALNNASRDYQLNEIEKDIILKHMFPLNLTAVPGYREAWIVTMADKYCSLMETLMMRSKHRKNRTRTQH